MGDSKLLSFHSSGEKGELRRCADRGEPVAAVEVVGE